MVRIRFFKRVSALERMGIGLGRVSVLIKLGLRLALVVLFPPL